MKIKNWSKIIDNSNEVAYQNDITELLVVVENHDNQWAVVTKEDLEEMGTDLAVAGINSKEDGKDAAREWMKDNPLPDSNSDGELVFEEVVAKNGQDYISVEYIFHKGSMQGATGHRLHVVTEEEREEQMDRYYDDPDEYSPIYDLWQQAVDAGRTDKSLDEYAAHLKRHEGDRMIFDWYTHNPDSEQAREIFQRENPEKKPSDIAGVEMTGAGRMFPDSFDEMKDKYDKIYNEELLKKVAKIESRDA